MPKSETINELAKALVAAQSEISGAVKASKNPFFKSDYADLTSVWEAIRGPLTKNGLAVIQTTAMEGADCHIITMLIHTSGQWVEGDLCLKPLKADPQSVGSAITYARRYALAAMVGVAPVDDDGNAATGRTDADSTNEHGQGEKSARPAPAPAPAKTTPPEDCSLVSATVDEVLKKSGGGGETGKQPWTKYTIVMDGDYYSTFDVKIAEAAKVLIGKKAELFYIDDGKYKMVQRIAPELF